MNQGSLAAYQPIEKVEPIPNPRVKLNSQEHFGLCCLTEQSGLKSKILS